MNINERNITKTILTICLAYGLSLGTQLSGENADSWGDVNLCGVRESDTTALFNPGRYAFDDDIATAWTLVDGATSGWTERYWNEPQYLRGATINADIPEEVELRFYYEANDHWVPLSGATLTGEVSGKKTIYFSNGIPRVERMLITLKGEKADEASVWGVSWLERNDNGQFGKIHPESYSFNQEEYINLKPSRLWEGGIGSTWFEPLWSFPYEVFQADKKNSPDSIFPPYKGNPPKAAEIIWELDSLYEITTLKAYFQAGWRSIAFEFWDGTAWSEKQSLGRNIGQGWSRIDLKSSIKTTRVKITFPAGWEYARFIRQIEVWGFGCGKDTSRVLPLSALDSEGLNRFTVSDAKDTEYQLEITEEGYNSTAIKGLWNGDSISGDPLCWQGEDTVYRITLAQDALRDDYQYLALAPENNLRGVVLQEKKDAGRIFLGGEYDDGYINEGVQHADPKTEDNLVKEKSWTLTGEYELERIRIYTSEVVSLTVKIGKRNKMKNMPVSWDEEAGCWDVTLSGIEADTINVSSLVPFKVYEAELYGSSLTAEEVPIEVWWPSKDTLVTTEGNSSGSIIGWMGDSSIQPSIGSYNPRQSDKLFWIPISELPLDAMAESYFTITGKLGYITNKYRINLKLKNTDEVATLTQGEDLVSVSAASYVISGTVSERNARCFVNNKEVAIKDNAYSTSVTLSEGFQYISVRIYDKSLRKILKSFNKPIYRVIGLPVIELDLPHSSLWTQSETIKLSGRVGNGIGLQLTMNGEVIELQEDSFSIDYQIAEGENTIVFLLTDDIGRTSTQTLMIHEDSVLPVFSILTPSEGAYLADSKVVFTLDGTPDEQLWWQFNTEEWEKGSSSVKVKSYTLDDGYYSYSFRAQDRSGNISIGSSVNFCVDITIPTSFTITSNVSGWTNNNTPTIEFATTDVTSGVDHYEYRVDDDAWNNAESPLILPVVSDGEHTVFVRAYDKAGNFREEQLDIKIDTSMPEVPSEFDPVPGTDNITVNWFGIDDGESYQTYRIERSPAWEDGVRAVSKQAYGDQSYRDTDVTENTTYAYRVWAVDRAGNESEKTEWRQVTVGLGEAIITTGKDTKLEYENLVVSIPSGAMADDITRVMVTELPVDSLDEKPSRTLISDIFQIVVVRTTDTGEEEISAHADLLKPVVITCTYDVNQIPSDYTESDIKPYYYNDIWGLWAPYNNAGINAGTHEIIFETNHFTDFSVQATKSVDVSPQELRDVEFSPFAGVIGQSPVTVSNNGGGVSCSFTELALPGKNGLDLTLSRSYSTAQAKADAGDDEYEVNGLSSLKIADGWYFNLPYMQWSDSGVWLSDLNGNVLSYSHLDFTQKTTDGDYISIYAENHTYTDCSIVLKLKKKQEYAFLIFPYYSYKMSSATLFMKDGREIDFNSSGRAVKILDATRLNAITLEYTNSHGRLSKITDSMGRNVTFTHAPSVITIGVEAGNNSVDNKITYTLDGKTLSSATDIGGRTWNYEYENYTLASSSVLQNPPDDYEQADDKEVTVKALSLVSGPGIGKTTIGYEINDLTYDKTIDKYRFVVTTPRLVATDVKTFLIDGVEALRSTNYAFTFGYEGFSQFYTAQSIVNDGRIIETTTFDKTEKECVSLSDAPEALKKAFDFEIGTRDEDPEVINYVSSISRRTVTSEFVSDEKQVWDTDFMRLSSRGIYKVKNQGTTNSSVTSYEYDDWGNITIQEEDTVIDSRKTKKSITRLFYIPSTTIDMVVADDTFSDLLSAKITKLPAVTNYKYDLLAKEKVVLGAYRTENDTNEEQDTQLVAYTYSSLGQCLNKYQLVNEGELAETKYDYNKDNGEVEKVTSSEGQVKMYATAYPLNNLSETYTKTIKQENVLLGNDTQKDLVTNENYYWLTGLLESSIDPEEYKTSFTYDNLGRVTSKEKFIINNTTASIRVDYDDKTLMSTVANELGGITQYSFDSIGRLTSVKKTESSDKENIVTTTTVLEYDGYDQVIEMIGPIASNEVDTNRVEENIKTTFSYDKQGRLLTTKAPGSIATKRYSYDDDHNIILIIDEEGSKTRETTDWNGNVIVSESYLDNAWITTKTYYDALNKTIAYEDAKGNKTTLLYNALGLLEKTIYPSRVVFEKNDATVAPEVSNFYNNEGHLILVKKTSKNGDIVQSNSLNGLGWVLSSEVPESEAKGCNVVKTYYTYDGVGNIRAQQVGYSTDTQSELPSKQWDYNGNRAIISETDELGNTTTYDYDPAGNRIKVVDPRATNSEDKHFTLTIIYDQFSKVLGAVLPKLPDASEADSAPEVTYTYDGHGNLVSKKEADGIVTTYGYSFRNLLTSEIISNAEGTTKYTTRYTYDDAGRNVSITYPTGRTVSINYDDIGRVISEGSADAGWMQYQYDPNGNKTVIIDQRGNKSAYEYNVDNQVTKITDAKDKITSIAYDRLGEVTKRVDSENNVRAYSYDNLGRLLIEKTPTGSTHSYTYDANGNVTTYVDPRGTIFTREYTVTNKLLKEIATNGNVSETVTYDYDEAGNLKSTNNGVVTSYNMEGDTYQPNAYGLVMKRSSSIAGTNLSMGYSYDNRQRLTGITFPDNDSIAYGYDTLGNLSSMKGFISSTISYDDYGRLEKYQFTNGIEKEFEYDSLDRFSSIKWLNAGDALLDYNYVYDKTSNILMKNENVYTYDELNQLTSAQEKGSFQQLPEAIDSNLFEFERDFDGQGNPSSIIEADAIVVFDAASKSLTCDLGEETRVNMIELAPNILTTRVRDKDISIYCKSERAESNSAWIKITGWRLDKNNDTGALRVYFSSVLNTRCVKVTTIWDDRNENNESVDTYSLFKNVGKEILRVWTLSDEHEETYSYDSSGNRISYGENGSKTNYIYYLNEAKGNLPWVKYDGSWYYTYDVSGNRLAKGKALISSNQSITVDTSKEYWTYIWDLHNRLISVKQHSGSEADVNVSYVYDSENYRVSRTGKDGVTIYSYGRNGALTYQKNITSGFERKYAYLNDQIVGWTETQDDTENTYYAITDNLGSVIKVVNNSGTIVWKSDYLPFGEASGIEGSYRFEGMYTGKDIDAETGLTYHWNRWRNEDGYAFISEDPAQDGINWYRYVGNNPLVSLDPTGLSVLDDYAYQTQNEDDKKAAAAVEERDHPYSGESASIVSSIAKAIYERWAAAQQRSYNALASREAEIRRILKEQDPVLFQQKYEQYLQGIYDALGPEYAEVANELAKASAIQAGLGNALTYFEDMSSSGKLLSGFDLTNKALEGQVGNFVYQVAGGIAIYAALSKLSFPKLGRTAAGKGGTPEGFTRVGRWMSPAEAEAMQSSGKVQLSGGNMTHVTSPADASAFKAASPGSVFVEFDVSSGSMVTGGKPGWSIIPGPGSIYDRFSLSKGGSGYQQPNAFNITITGSN